jgi:hypothetical protein
VPPQIAAFTAVVMGVVVSASGVFEDPSMTHDAKVRAEVGEAGMTVDDGVDIDDTGDDERRWRL